MFVNFRNKKLNLKRGSALIDLREKTHEVRKLKFALKQEKESNGKLLLEIEELSTQVKEMANIIQIQAKEGTSTYILATEGKLTHKEVRLIADIKQADRFTLK